MKRPDTESIRILAVDDEPGFVDLTAEFLERTDDDFSVATETEPTAALDRLDDNIDCVVSDYDMPNMDGIELLRAVRERYPDLPFILFTGKGSEHVASEAISAGVTDYLNKNGGGTDQYDILGQQIRNTVEKHRVESRIERSYKAIETVPAGIAFLDENGEFTYVNDAYSNMYGYRREELVGSHWELLYRDEDVDELYDRVLPQAENGVWNGKSVQLDKDGNTVIADHSLTYTEDGTLICAVKDVTEREQALTDLSLKEHAMDAAPVGITIADATQSDEPLIYVNDEFENLTGYPKERALGENCRFLQGEGTAEEPVAALREALDAEKPVTVELRNYRQDGTEFWNRVSIAPIRDEDGTVTHYVGFQEDITERKQIEKEAHLLLDQFEGFENVLRHDLQKPLAKARGAIELARQTETKNDLENADRALGRLSTLIDDFADILEKRQLITDPTDISIGDVSESVWESVMPETATLERVDPPRIRADRMALRRLLANLFQNACQHGSADVTVRVGATPQGFYVADDGPGIPVEKSDEVFMPGFTTHEDGSGLGLASVRQIVVAHGWEITVTESQSGGARFEITTDGVGRKSFSSQPHDGVRSSQ